MWLDSGHLHANASANERAGKIDEGYVVGVRRVAQRELQLKHLAVVERVTLSLAFSPGNFALKTSAMACAGTFQCPLVPRDARTTETSAPDCFHPHHSTVKRLCHLCWLHL